MATNKTSRVDGKKYVAKPKPKTKIRKKTYKAKRK